MLRVNMPLASLLFLVAASAGLAQESRPVGADARPYRYTIWDLELGSHASELRRDVYAEFACGTNGGPPSVQLAGWTEFSKCRAEPGSGFHEVYFRYDDEFEYRGLARDPDRTGLFRPEGTSEFQIPVIVSALFDENGFLVGTRLVTDPRTDAVTRERGANLTGVFQARFGIDPSTCTDLPRSEGESAYRGTYAKERCEALDPQEGVRRILERHIYRKPGQNLLDPVTGLRTIGYFVSDTRLETFLQEPIANPEERLANLSEPEPTEVEKLAERARDCPGCDLAGVNLKRANLENANLAGADLTGANLHGANLAGANLTDAQLPLANLNRADLRRATLRGANLIETLLYQARFDAADLSGADMSGALAARLQMIRANAPGLFAQEADLRYARMSDSNFSGADFSYSQMQQTHLGRADFSDADLDQALLWRAVLTEADLSGVTAKLAEFTGANLRGADISDADFTAARFNLATLADVTASGAEFKGAVLPPGFP